MKTRNATALYLGLRHVQAGHRSSTVGLVEVLTTRVYECQHTSTCVYVLLYHLINYLNWGCQNTLPFIVGNEVDSGIWNMFN